MSIVQRFLNRINKSKLKRALFEISEYKNIEGWLTDREAYGLYSISRKVKKNGVIVEIGSWKGKSTFCLAKGLKNGKVFAIDPFNAEGESGSKEKYEETKGTIPLFEQFSKAMMKYGVWTKIEPLQGYSSQFKDKFKQIDLLFIDGDHSIEGCDYDFVNFSTFVKPGGFIAFHDYDPDRTELGPTWVINNRLSDKRFMFYKRYDSLWIAKII